MEDCIMLDAFEQRLTKRLGKQRYGTWFDGAVQFELCDEQLVLRAASSFERDLVRRRFSSDIESEARLTWDRPIEVRYLLNEGVEQDSCMMTARPATAWNRPQATPTTAKTPVPGQSPKRDAVRPPIATEKSARRTDWISGAPTVEAESACNRLVRGEFKATPILLWGSPGVGKTHLLRSINSTVRSAKRRTRVLSLTAEQFLVAFVEAVRGGGLPSFRQKHRGVDLLIVDNVQELIGKQRTLEEFQHTLDALLADGAQVVVASDRGPNELRELGPELASRLLNGVVVELGAPDTQMRTQLIQRLAQQRGLKLDPMVIDRLASRLTGGAREATGALHRLELISESTGQAIDYRLAERVANEINRVAAPPVRLDDIQNAVCSVFGLDASTLKSNKRTKAVAEPRMLAMWLARKMTRSAWSEIGDYFGRRSHSTVISAHRRVERLLANPEPARLCGPAGDLHEAIRRVEAVLRTA